MLRIRALGQCVSLLLLSVPASPSLVLTACRDLLCGLPPPSLQKSEVAAQPRVRGAVQAGVPVPGPCGQAQREQGETGLKRM